jgi:hypothetical protein
MAFTSVRVSIVTKSRQVNYSAYGVTDGTFRELATGVLLVGSVEAKSYSGKNANERSEELKTINQ